MEDFELLNRTFDLYMEKGRKAKEKGDLVLAKRNFLLAGETMMKIAKQSEGSLKDSRMSRAMRIVELSERMESDSKEKKNTNNSSTEAEDEDAKKWQAAEVPNIHFSDVAGLEDVKKAITIRMINPIKYPEKYQLYQKKTGGGVLLYGPPGTGKTMIAKAIACEVGAKFYAVKGSDIVSKWVGDSEKNINSLFAEANKQDRAIIFIDEMDSLLGKRGVDSHNDKRVNEFLQQIDGFAGRNQNLLLLGATNRPWDIDSAATRSGRFSQKIYIPLPDAPARKFMIEKAMKGVPVVDDFSIDKIVEATEMYSGADLEELCDRAKDEPLLQSIESGEIVKISNEDFERILDVFPPSVTEKELKSYEDYNGEVKSLIEKNKK